MTYFIPNLMLPRSARRRGNPDVINSIMKDLRHRPKVGQALGRKPTKKGLRLALAKSQRTVSVKGLLKRLDCGEIALGGAVFRHTRHTHETPNT